MHPSFRSDFNGPGRQSATTPASRPGSLPNALGIRWSAADIAMAAERGAAYPVRQVLPAFDPSDPRTMT